MLITEEDLALPSSLSPYAPTAATTANQISSASSGLENLINLAVGGYTAVLNAKNDATKAKLALANNNGVAANPTASPSDLGFGLNTKTVLLGAAALGVGIVALALIRRK